MVTDREALAPGQGSTEEHEPMRSCRAGWLSLAAGCLVMACVGCPRRDSPELPTGPAGVDRAGQAEQAQSPLNTNAASVEPTAKPDTEPPPPPEVPEVHLTDSLLATCLVRVDDVMPDDELPDLEGNPHRLSDLLGEKLTVVFFWTVGDSPYSVMAATSALEDLQKDIAEPYSEKGVQVIGINVREEPEVARKHLAQAEATFPSLVDREGAFFSQVATEKLPRVYLLDAAGRILWFDLEYSRTTHRDVLQAIRVELGEL